MKVDTAGFRLAIFDDDSKERVYSMFYGSTFKILSAAILSMLLASCGSLDEGSNLQIAERRSVAINASALSKVLQTWRSNLSKKGLNGVITENSGYTKEDIKTFEKFGTCIKTNENPPRVFGTFFDVSMIEGDVSLSPSDKAKFVSLFKKKRFGSRSYVCDIQKNPDVNYSDRVFVSGDKKYDIRIRIKK